MADDGIENNSSESKYSRIIELVFERFYQEGSQTVSFTRDDMRSACVQLGVTAPRNLGDVPYSFRFRRELPQSIKVKAPEGTEWIIWGTGQASYQFRLASKARISPNPNMLAVKIPDATPEIVAHYGSGMDEQALLTKARYNRLVDLFAGITCYSIQNHLRTTVGGIGQIEVDEIYVGVDRGGRHFILPCQAKSPKDQFGIVQVMQDIELCKKQYPHAICRPVALQFMAENKIAMLELTVVEEDERVHLKIVCERHYHLVSRSELSNEEIDKLRSREP